MVVQYRLRLLMAASALLYFGPLLAGLGGMGWDAVPVFIALFALWLVVMRPKTWPRDIVLWSMETASSALAQILVNAGIVVVLFALGRGFGGVAGFVPNIPPLLPVALSFLATPLSWMVWAPRKGDQTDHLVDSTLRMAGNDYRPLTAGPDDPILNTLLDLPDEADPTLTAEALSLALQGHQGLVRLSMLEDRLDYSDTPRTGLRRGLIIWATNPSSHHGTECNGANCDGLTIAFASAGLDPDLLLLFSERGMALLGLAPHLASRFPPASQIEISISESQPRELRDALRGLTLRLRALAGQGAKLGA